MAAHREHRDRWPIGGEWLWCGAIYCLALVVGCGTQPSGHRASEQSERSSKKKPQNSQLHAETRVTQDAQGQKSLDGIPYDVWFDDPQAVAENSAVAIPRTPAAGSSPTPATARPATNATVPEPTPSTTSASTNDWSAFIATEQLQEETKKIRNQLKSLLQNQASYTSEFEQVKMHGAVLAALAGIVAEGGESVSWKPNAPYIRDFGQALYEAAKGPGKPNYDKSRDAFENIESVLGGSIPVGAQEPAPQRPLAEVASRFYLMKRMKLAFEALKFNINSEAKIKSEQDLAMQETMVLSALSKAVSLEGYDSADEAEYQQSIQEMIRRCLEATAATKDADYPSFQEAINRIEKTCNDCHVQYRNG